MPGQIQSLAGPLPTVRQAGAAVNPAGTFGEALISRGTMDYYPLVKAGRMFAGTCVNASIYGGDPGNYSGSLCGLWNPPGSGADFVLCTFRLAVRTLGVYTAAASRVAYWQTSQLVPVVTSTTAVPINLCGLSQEGSRGVFVPALGYLGFGSSDGWFMTPGASLSATGTPADRFANVNDDVRGAIVVPPGTILTVAAPFVGGDNICGDVALTWAEIPV